MKKFLPIIIALVIGLVVGLGAGHIQVKKAQKVFDDKTREADRKVAFIEKQLEDARTEATASTASIQQQCTSDEGKLSTLRIEKNSLSGQVRELDEQLQKMDSKAAESDRILAKTKKESAEISATTKKEIQELEQNKKDLKIEQKKMTSDKQNLQVELKKTGQDLGRCVSNNAELTIISEELLKKYRNKGLGAVIAAKEPLTEIRKIELEQLTQKYREEIDKLKTEKK